MGGGKDDPDDAYFAQQWGALQKAEKERGDAWRRKWWESQRREQGRAPYSPWLVVPIHPTDCGIRPLPAGTPYWASPFIGVTSPDPSGRPLAGAANQVHAQVFNLGAATSAPTLVSFYWADPSVGLGAADAHPIGSVMVEIPPLTAKLVTCPTPWVPSFLNGGHECLFVTAENAALDPLTAPFAPFAPWADRHVGQRNMNVLPAVEQAFPLWLPASGAREMTLHVLALKIRVEGGLPHLATPVQTIDQVAHWVLAGLAGGKQARDPKGKRPPAFTAERIDALRVIDDVKLLGATRRAKPRRFAEDHETLRSAHVLGDTVLRIEGDPAHARLCSIRLRDTGLAENEFVLLNIACVAGEVVEGGYLLTLANPTWFKPGRTAVHHKEGQGMTSSDDRKPHYHKDGDDLRDLVIHTNPQARATLDIVRSLAPHLPIKSAEEFGRGMKVGDRSVPGAVLAQYAAGLVPITTEEDLVHKVAAMLRVFVDEGEAHRPSLSSGAAHLLDTLTSPDGKPAIPVLVGRGRPIFPVKPQKQER